MTFKDIASKMNAHAALATEAWNYGNLFDYHIENARVELAIRTMNRRSRIAATAYYQSQARTETES